MNEIEKLDYVYEWPLEEERLSELRSYSQNGAMNDEQTERYEKLERLVAESRYILQRLHEKAGL